MVDTKMNDSVDQTTVPFAPAPTWISRYAPSFKLDEGYSEDTKSQSETDVVMRSDSRYEEMPDNQSIMLPDWLLALSEADRCEFTYAILRTLPTSSIASIVDRLNPLLHIDPVGYLPPEITSQIFSYLEPAMLLRASALSKSWRSRALDSQLWRLLFRLEGWTANLSRTRQFEEKERARRKNIRERRSRTRRAEGSTSGERPAHKKRAYAGGILNGGREVSPSANIEPAQYPASEWVDQHGTIEADDSPPESQNDRMQDVSFSDAGASSSNHLLHGQDTARFARADGYSDSSRSFVDSGSGKAPTSSTRSPLEPPLQPSLYLTDSTDNAKINWHYLYKQRQKLEENWNAVRYTNFQLPHPNFKHEAHTECVYTIQFSGQYLVSGSRDKSVRIWNLETQRLHRPPLMGHNMSVLCLQFDEDPAQDIIISGGSDQHILIWKFSTGQLVRKLENAHAESVLNLRFDNKYLVTCSKDKTIKVWNRKQLEPTDDAYPLRSAKSGPNVKFPAHIINIQDEIESQHLRFTPLPELSLLMTLDGHSAAVNAIQIYGGQIVSASGDRYIKVWDIRTGELIRTVVGHNKGIACVQYDGRRIVSGSSDETVRIFDPATGAEVACLQGHTNLVRTVQATFGDYPGNEEELEAEAREVDANYFKAREQGLLEPQMSRERRRTRNAGSRDPRDLDAFGAKLPPGGGGTRWARIVSGSYDESIIIWRKEPSTGKWVIGKVLLQHEAVRAAGGCRRTGPPHPAHAAARPPLPGGAAPNGPPGQPATVYAQAGGAQQTAANQLATVQANFQALAAQANAQVAHAQMLAQQAQALQAQTQQVQAQQAANQQQQLTTAAAQVQGAVQNVQAAQGAPLQDLAHVQQGNSTAAAPNQPTAQAQGQALVQAATPNAPQVQAQPQPQGHAAQPAPAPTAPNAQNQTAPPAPQVPHHHHHPPGHPHQHHVPPHPPHHPHGHGMPPTLHQASTNSRVFKLQFDARRIICCSQDPTIVGWDFANGERGIVEASRFFGELL